jgi:uncharacterized membrane protein
MSEPKRTRLVFLGFTEEGVATNVLEVIRDGIDAKEIVVEDWAMVHKAQGGELTITNNESMDPGAVRGGLFGGAAAMLLASFAGPVGVGALAAGTAIGAVTAAAMDSGMKDEDIVEVSKFMADGRTGILIAMPLAETGRWDAFVASHVEFESPDKTYSVDIVPGRTFEQALEEYRRDEEA